MKHLSIIMLLVTALATIGNAQDVITPAAPVTATRVTTDKVNVEIIASSSTKVVKGAPFSAEGVSESVQVLPDGNRITRSTTTKMYRDGEGRFRREAAGKTGNGEATAYGSLISAYGFQDTISIYDPVEAVRYVLTPSTKSARRFNSQNIRTEGAVIVNGNSMSEAVKLQTELKAAAAYKANAQNAPNANVVVLGNVAQSYNAGKAEPLGTKTIEGVEAEGSRTVTTIAAGTIGNEKPIEIVYERWYSKELDLIVYSRHYDPRFGEQTYRLTNINRTEPDRSLFTVPSDYKVVVDESKFNVINQRNSKNPQ